MLTRNTEKLEELEKKYTLAESENENLKHELKHITEMSKEERRVNERTLRNLENKLNMFASETESLKKEKSNLADEVKRSSFRVEDVERERNIVVEESENLRKLHAEKLNEAVAE